MATITFGKHSGKPISEVPQSYLLWCAENMDFKSDKLKQEIESAIDMDRVTLGFGKYKDTPLDEIPNDYLIWLVDHPTKSPRINDFVQKHVQPIMPIGKHKGELMYRLEAGYKQWLITNEILKSPYLISQM